MDPNYNTTITRVTNTAGNETSKASQFQVPEYPKFSAFNSNNKYVMLRGANGYNIYNMQNNFAWVKTLPFLTQGGTEPEARWDYTGNFPNRVYYRVNAQFRQMDVVTLTDTLLYDFHNDFPQYSNLFIFMDDEGDSSGDSRYWCWMAIDGNAQVSTDNLVRLITYDKQTDTIIGSINPLTVDPGFTTRPNFVGMSIDGTKAILGSEWHGGTVNGIFDGPHAVDLNLTTNPIRIGDEAKHSGSAFDANGNEVYVNAWSGTDYISATDIHTGVVTQIIYHGTFSPTWATGWHFGRMYSRNLKGWIMMSTEKGASDVPPPQGGRHLRS